jgi:formylglycine-generating enzyme required for sulfatase activity
VHITKPFVMAATEAEQSQYKAVMGRDPSRFKGEDHPVEQISWNDVQAFCRALSQRDGVTYRLPTEAEWEYACRAGTTTPFYTGATISTEQTNYDGNYTYGDRRKGEYRQKTTPVASFPANPWGLYDMHGNVWEWCQDWYREEYYKVSAAADPTGPASGSSGVLNGGSWADYPGYCRSADRSGARMTSSYAGGGFRVVVVIAVQ